MLVLLKEGRIRKSKMKICSKCGSEKDRSEFYRDKSHKDGLQSRCKECDKGKVTKWAKANPGKRTEQVAKYDRKYRAKYPDRIRARQAVQDALRTDRLVKEPCACGETNVQGHHKSYEEDKWLDVDWLCRKHHLDLHQGNKNSSDRCYC